MRTTSLNAYHELKDSKIVGKQASFILSCVQAVRDYSLQELCKITGMPINAVSGRCNDLKKAGLLTESTKRKCSVTGRTVHPVALPQRQAGLFI